MSEKKRTALTIAAMPVAGAAVIALVRVDYPNWAPLLIVVAYAAAMTLVAAIYAIENADRANRIGVLSARLSDSELEVANLRWLLADARRARGAR